MDMTTNAKLEFFRNMDHRMRQPLTRIIGWSQFMVKGKAGELSDNCAKDIDAIFQAGKKLQQHIEAILEEMNKKLTLPTQNDLAKMQKHLDLIIQLSESMIQNLDNTHLEYVNDIFQASKELSRLIDAELEQLKAASGKLLTQKDKDKIKIDIAEAVESIIREFREEESKRSLTIAPYGLSDIGSIVTYKDTFHTLIRKLMFNTVEFTDDGGIISIIAERTPEKLTECAIKDSVIISFENTGNEIQDHDRDKLFDLFSVLDPKPIKKYKGTGLELPLCKIIAENLGGTIWVESSAGKNRFTCELPRGKSVLIVDDDPGERMFLEEAFKAHGYMVITASNGEKGIETAKEFHPDLICMDIHMPRMDGTEALNELKKDEKTKKIPVIALTGYARDDLRIAPNFDDFITKPPDMDKLIDMVWNRIGN